MADRDDKTVIVHDRDDEPHSSNIVLWVVIAIVVILLLFLLFGGMSLFQGSGSNGGMQNPPNVGNQ